jgi:hypothetical protein
MARRHTDPTWQPQATRSSHHVHFHAGLARHHPPRALPVELTGKVGSTRAEPTSPDFRSRGLSIRLPHHEHSIPSVFSPTARHHQRATAHRTSETLPPPWNAKTTDTRANCDGGEASLGCGERLLGAIWGKVLAVCGQFLAVPRRRRNSAPHRELIPTCLSHW